MNGPMKRARPPGNWLLDSLPPAELKRLEPHLAACAMKAGEELHQRASSAPFVYFPIDSVSSLVVALADGSTVEVATVGREGMVGLPVFIESEAVSMDSFIQVPGRALRMDRRILKSELRREEALSRRIAEYTEAVLLFIAQSAACSQVHGQRERCARWLLHVRDRVGGDAFPLTQNFLAQMLGVRRPTVTAVAGELRAQGLIAYRKGSVRVLDTRRLERVACDCYRVIRSEYRSMFEGAPFRT